MGRTPAGISTCHDRAHVFLLMYDMRSFQARKNPEAAIDSFAKAFPSARDAALVIKSSTAPRVPVISLA